MFVLFFNYQFLVKGKKNVFDVITDRISSLWISVNGYNFCDHSTLFNLECFMINHKSLIKQHFYLNYDTHFSFFIFSFTLFFGTGCSDLLLHLLPNFKNHFGSVKFTTKLWQHFKFESNSLAIVLQEFVVNSIGFGLRWFGCVFV